MTDQMAGLERVCRALADRTRLRILALLTTGEICVCHLHETLRVPQPTVSRHLAYLRRAGLVATRKDGLWVHYRLADLPDPVLRTVRDAVTHALWHLAAVQRDAKRLSKATACAVAPVGGGAPGCACCVSAARPNA
jgi:ArsR family transcriptional regulator, arsenate/arsenite/antimonite-responsive transcriptional repressor